MPYNEEIGSDHGVSVKEILQECSKDESTWKKNEMPNSETLRRMILLANWAANNPKQWFAYYLYYIEGITSSTEIAWKLHAAERTVRRWLQPVYLKYQLKRKRRLEMKKPKK